MTVQTKSGFEFWIDRGGTFTDVIARKPDGTVSTEKLLSDNPGRYRDAALAAIRQLLGVAPDAPLPIASIDAVKMGTTVATNALLERRGEPTALFITRGFRDQLRIGYQNRPKLFERHIRLPELLYGAVYEIDERLDAHGGTVVPLDEAALFRDLQAAREAGYASLAIVFMHGYRFAQHERRAGALAREAGFTQVSLSHEVSPLMKIVGRGDTTVADAYLSPILRRYVEQVASELESPRGRVPLYFMKSDGGLTRSERFQGKDSVLSGPAGGIVGMVKCALAAGIERVIGFDMGGTSTDVSHFAGTHVADCERVFDTMVAGVRLRAPMMSIHTIAAGGGSILRFDGQKFRVGPASAGAVPGPACYRRGGPLTVTDCNVMLGKLQPEFFPALFGERGDEALDRARVEQRFQELADEVARATGNTMTREQVAEGFLRIAVANMANAIKFISVQRGYDVTSYTLACFGGAGGQHACLVADELGIERVYIHPLSGVLSAYGMGLADVGAMREASFERTLDRETVSEMGEVLARIGKDAHDEVSAQGIAAQRIKLLARAHLKYAGTDTALVVPAGDETVMRSAFEAAYRTRFSFLMEERAIVIESLSVEAVGESGAPTVVHVEPPTQPAASAAVVTMYTRGASHQTPVYRREQLARGQIVTGPAIVAERNGTTVIEPGFRASLGDDGALLLERYLRRERTVALGTSVDPVMLELFNNLFMSIAEQMGVRLAATAHSVNIKERLDFSCALFDGAGNLIANAPHMPVHLGSMGESIKCVIRNNAAVAPGDVYMLNDPYHGGTHLPDVTVVMPVFGDGERDVLFYVAARGHHADIGGITPGSMPPNSHTIEEEGVLIDNFKLVERGVLREAAVRELLMSARFPARNPEQNLADLRAQVAACEKGREELARMVREFGLDTVRAYMRHVQDNAAESVRRAISSLRDGAFTLTLDSGAEIQVKITVDPVQRAAKVDFTGTSAQLASNFNAPPAVTHAAVLYVFRTLVDDDIPMNAGCLEPIEIVIPDGSMLAPHYPAATVAGNVETSQCITDALYGALGVLAGSQGTMNNFTFGSARHQYYETIAGGSGAGPDFPGTAAVQTHMTNSRMTDPEVLEFRFPVLVEEHSIRHGSGGRGRQRGGDGALRRIRFLEPMTAAIVAGRRRLAPHGMAGGSPGERGRSWVERRKPDGSFAIEELDYAAQVEMNEGDVFVVSTPSGGGYGAAD
jgi:5-oxoprolinase (ATP-hydrolysing)